MLECVCVAVMYYRFAIIVLRCCIAVCWCVAGLSCFVLLFYKFGVVGKVVRCFVGLMCCCLVVLLSCWCCSVDCAVVLFGCVDALVLCCDVVLLR